MKAFGKFCLMVLASLWQAYFAMLIWNMTMSVLFNLTTLTLPHAFVLMQVLYFFTNKTTLTQKISLIASKVEVTEEEAWISTLASTIVTPLFVYIFVTIVMSF